MKKYTILLGALLLSSTLLADDFDSFDDFGDEDSSPKVEFSYKGSVGYEHRTNVINGYNQELPFATFEPTLESEYLDIIGNFTVDKYDERIKTEEFYGRFYIGDKLQLEVGREKLVWGKGDKVHLVNNINATDYRDFINGDYAENLIGEDMIRLIYTPFSDSEAKIELVYTPSFRPDKFATDGQWKPNEMKTLDTGLAKLGKSSNDFLPKQKAFKDDQFGARFTNSNDGLDYGFTYYHGFEKRPTVDKKKLIEAQAFGIAVKKTMASTGLPEKQAANLVIAGQVPGISKEQGMAMYSATTDIQSGNLDVHYDQVDVFGFEASKVVIGGINGRFETAYYLTKDIKGTDPNVKNNRIGTLIGGDRSMSDFGWHNITLNAQLRTIFTLNKDEIKKNEIQGYNYDADYSYDGHYVQNALIFKIDDHFRSDTINPALKFIWNIESQDFAIMPELEYIYKDETYITIGYNIYDGGEKTEIGQFRKNDYGYIKVEYHF